MNFLSFFLLLVRAPRGGNIPSERQNWVPSVDMRSSSWPHMFAVKSPFFFFFTSSISPQISKPLDFKRPLSLSGSCAFVGFLMSSVSSAFYVLLTPVFQHQSRILGVLLMTDLPFVCFLLADNLLKLKKRREWWKCGWCILIPTKFAQASISAIYQVRVQIP